MTVICVVITHCVLISGSAVAGTFTIGTADGSFENGFTGMVSEGDVRLVENFGILKPTQGSWAAVMTSEPDEGSTQADADVSSITIENLSIPADASTLRLDYNFLTDEPNPSRTNDRFTVSLVLVTASGEEELLAADTFSTFYPAPWTGYVGQTGFLTLQADISAHAGSSDTFSLVLKVADVGDGRTNSAVMMDSLQFAQAGEPTASSEFVYTQVSKDEAVQYNGLGSSDDGGTITNYYWDFKNGYYGNGPVVSFAYAEDGVYQPTLTVTDDEGNTQTVNMIVVVGDLNHAPSITSAPNISAVEELEYIYQVLVSDPEAQYGDVMTFSLEDGPSGMTINEDTGLISWTPVVGGARKNPVTVKVTDSQGLSDTQSFQVSIGAETYIVATDDYSLIYTARSNGDGSFGPLTFIADVGHYTRGAAIGDFDHDGDFDFVSGHGNNSPYIHLYYYEKQGTGFLPPVYLGPVGDSSNSAGSWLMDMAAEDFNNDGEMDFVVNGDAGSNTWLFLNRGALEFGEENFFLSDFETNSGGWFGNSYYTGVERVDTTQYSGAWSMRVYATGDNSRMYYRLRPTDWYQHTGPMVSFAYRMPPGTPATLFFNVDGKGWICLGKSPAGDSSTYPYVNGFELIDDDGWHTVTFDLYEAIRQYWPDAGGRISEVEWWTNSNASNGQQFWFDDFKMTKRTYVSGFDVSILPSTGGNGRGMDAADVNRDGNMDFVRARYSDGLVYLYAGDGAGGFTTTNIVDAGSDPYGTVLADFDEDGKIDLIAEDGSGGNPYFFKGNGNGTFQAGVYIASLDTNNHTSYGAYDFNNDGHQDIVAVNYTSRQVLLYPGNGDATFGTSVQIGTTTYNTLGVAAPAGRVVGQPFSVATQDKTIIDEGESVFFDASLSYDDGAVVAFEWDFGDGTTDSGPADTHSAISHTFTHEGSYQILVTVTDDEGNKDRRRMNLIVNGTPPVAAPGGSYTIGEDRAVEGRWAAVLDGSGSSDLETSVIRYEWDFDNSDGITVEDTGVSPRHIYTTPGVYTVTLTVYDEVNQSHTATATITVTGNDVPVAAISGPLSLDESDASLGAWTGWYDLSTSSDDYNVAEYRVDWGDSTTTTLYGMREEFSDGDYTTGPAWTTRYGIWIVENEELKQTSTYGNWMWFQDLNRSYTDFILEVDFKAEGDTDGYMGIVFRNANSLGSTDSYLMHSRNSWDYWNFYDWKEGKTLVNGGTGWDPGIWYHLKLVVQDGMMRLYVTPEGGVETLQIEAPATRHPEGGIGLLAHSQVLVYDNVKVTPLHRLPHTYSATGEYTVTLEVTDNAGQTATASLVTTVDDNDPPVADAGGPYTLDEWDAWNGRWDFVLDAGGSGDDVNIERYIVDFGDGTSYTTSFADGKKTGYFTTGTDIYGYDLTQARVRIIATQDDTTVDIINLDTGFVIDSSTLNRYGYWDAYPGDGIYFKVKSTKPVVVYETDFDNHSAFVPSLENDPVGKEFIFHRDANHGFYVFAFEDALVTFYNTNGTIALQRQMAAGTYWQPGLSQTIYRAVSSGRIAMQTTGANGYTTVPSDNGSPVGRQFLCAIYNNTTASVAVFAHEDAQVDVYDLDAGLLHTHSMAAGETWYQNGLETRRLRLESTGNVEVWAGSTEGGSGIEYLGDDVSVTSGRDGKDFYLHNLMDGIVIFAPSNNTQIDIDGGGLTATLNRDGYLYLAPADLPGGSGSHHITATEPVVIKTLGRANTYNDMGTYLGGVSARHLYTAAASYTVTVTAIDNSGQTSTATANVEVLAGDEPVPDISASAVVDEDSAAGGLWEVPFDASGSTDDTEIISYEWDFGDGTTGAGVNPTHYYSETGNYTVTLTVTDRAGQKVSKTFDLEVKQSAPPVADSGGPYVFGEESASHGVWTAALDGSGSSDDYDIYDFTWTFDPDFSDDFSGTAVNTDSWLVSGGVTQDETLSVPPAGWGYSYFASADNFSHVAGNTVEMRIVTPTGTQYAMFGIKNTSETNYTYTQMPHAIYFHNGEFRIYEAGSNRGTFGTYTKGETYDIRIRLKQAGAIYEYKHVDDQWWTQLYDSAYSTQSSFKISGTVNSSTFQVDQVKLYHYLTGPLVSRDFDSPGEYHVTLTVRDQALQAHSDPTTITIEDGSAPVADAGGPYTVEKGSLLLFNGTGSTDDTNIEKYAWTFGDYSAEPDAPGRLLYTAEGAAPRHFYQEIGTYDVSLTVTDNTGKTHTDTTTVDVVVGAPPVANAGGPYLAGVGGPPAYFDAHTSMDDYGIVEYRWDFNEQEDSDGDGNPTNDIDAVGPAPFHVFNGIAGDGLFIEESFDGTVLNDAFWLNYNAVQNDAVVLTGQGGWGSAYLFSAPFERSRVTAVKGRVKTDTGTHYSMWGVQNASTTNYGYNNMPHAIYFYNGALRIYENGSYRGSVGSYTKGVSYDVRIDIKDAGADYFIKETGADAWTQLTSYTSLNQSTALLRLGATMSSEQR